MKNKFAISVLLLLLCSRFLKDKMKSAILLFKILPGGCVNLSYLSFENLSTDRHTSFNRPRYIRFCTVCFIVKNSVSFIMAILTTSVQATFRLTTCDLTAEKEIFKLTGGLDALTWLAQNEGSVE